MHVKNMVPQVLQKEDDWKTWRAEVEDYCEEVFPKMKAVLEKVTKNPEGGESVN